SWGHDFRPDYLLLGSVIEALGDPRVLALTATAAPPVREEIVEQLGLRDAKVVLRDLDRPNIHLEVQHFTEASLKREALLQAVVETEGSGIVLCGDPGSRGGGGRGPRRARRPGSAVSRGDEPVTTRGR